MRGPAIALLAGLRSPSGTPSRRQRLLLPALAALLALSAPPAAALCADDGAGGCSRLSHSLDLEVSGECPDGAPLCIADLDGNLSSAPTDADYSIGVRNAAGSAVTVEVHAIARFDDASPDGVRRASDLLASVDVPAGEAVRFDLSMPGDVSRIRVQAMAADGRQAEADQELLAIRTLAFGDGIADSGVAGPEPADGADAPADGKGAPALPFALLAVGLLGALALAAGLRRDD